MHFFSREENYSKGFEYYEHMLQKHSEKKVRGELSDSYTYPEVYSQVAERIRSAYPGIKLLCILRNPLDRAFSDYLRSIGIGEVNCNISFEKAIELDPRYIQRGFYGAILENYSSYLNDNRLLVLFHEDLKTAPASLLKKLYGYLGVNDSFLPSVLTRKVNKAKMVRSGIIQRLINNSQRIISRAFRNAGLGFFLDGIKVLGIQNMVLNLNRKEISMSSETRKLLFDKYSYDIDKLSGMIGKDLSFWKA